MGREEAGRHGEKQDGVGAARRGRDAVDRDRLTRGMPWSGAVLCIVHCRYGAFVAVGGSGSDDTDRCGHGRDGMLLYSSCAPAPQIV